MAGNAVAPGEKSFEPVLLGQAEVFQVIEGLARAEQRADRDHQDVNQVVILGALDPRVRQVFAVFDQTKFAMILHPISSIPYFQKYNAKM